MRSPAAGTILLGPLGVVGVLTVLGPAHVDGQMEKALDRLESGSVGAPLPEGWEARSVGDAAPATSRVSLDHGGEPWLSVTATDAASQYWIQLDDPLPSDEGLLSWCWRVDRAIDGASLTDPERDDAPARLFVAFGDGGLLSSPTALFYSWGSDRSVPRIFRSHVSDRIGVIVLRTGNDQVHRWVGETRDVAADYTSIFGKAPTEPITAVGFMIDTEQTGATASSGLRALRWLPHQSGSVGQPSARTPERDRPCGREDMRDG